MSAGIRTANPGSVGDVVAVYDGKKGWRVGVATECDGGLIVECDYGNGPCPVPEETRRLRAPATKFTVPAAEVVRTAKGRTFKTDIAVRAFLRGLVVPDAEVIARYEIDDEIAASRR